MRKFLLVIAVFCFFFETSALADNEKAQKYLREAEYYVKKAESHEREATYYTKKAEGIFETGRLLLKKERLKSG